MKKIMTCWDGRDCYCEIRWNDEEEETAMKETARIQQTAHKRKKLPKFRKQNVNFSENLKKQKVI